MPEKVVDNQYTTFVFPQKPEKLTWKQFIYNEKTGKVFGRTRYSWGKNWDFIAYNLRCTIPFGSHVSLRLCIGNLEAAVSIPVLVENFSRLPWQSVPVCLPHKI